MKPSLLLWISLWSFATLPASGQTPEGLHSSRYSFELTHILTRDGTLKTGWFLGTVGDTLVAQIGGKSEWIARKDLLRVSVEGGRSKSGAALVGLLVGVYAGNALALRADGQPFLYMRSEEGLLPALYSALFGLVGGGLGYLAGFAQTAENTFDFSGSEEENADRWQSLAAGGSSNGGRASVHVSIQGSWVKGPLPNPDGGSHSSYYYAGRSASSLNMVRKMQVTYSATRFLDLGLAAVWLGQPSLSYYTNSPPYSGSTTLSLEGNGYFVVGVVQPLWMLGWRKVQWDVGVGIGKASVNFMAAQPGYYDYASGGFKDGKSAEVSRSGFTTLWYTELKVFLADYMSLGITADWVRVPQDIPDISGVTLESKNLGTSSVGFVLGFHL